MNALEKYVENHNSLNAIFSKDPIDLPTTKDQCKVLFARLSNELSPENLTSDGEASFHRVRTRGIMLRTVWSELEVIYGQKVSEDDAEIWSWA